MNNKEKEQTKVIRDIVNEAERSYLMFRKATIICGIICPFTLIYMLTKLKSLKEDYDECLKMYLRIIDKYVLNIEEE